jgi:hypothetical protein
LRKRIKSRKEENDEVLINKKGTVAKDRKKKLVKENNKIRNKNEKEKREFSKIRKETEDAGENKMQKKGSSVVFMRLSMCLNALYMKISLHENGSFLVTFSHKFFTNSGKFMKSVIFSFTGCSIYFTSVHI